MVCKKEIDRIFNIILNNSYEPNIDEKCKPGYISPSVRASKFNEKEFASEEYNLNQNPHPSEDEINMHWSSPQGRLQKIQSDLQKEVDYSNEDIEVTKSWSVSLFIPLNNFLYNGEVDYSTGVTVRDDSYNPDDFEDTFEYLDKAVHTYSVEESSDLLSNVIKKSPALQENAVTYRYGPVDDLRDMEVGDKGSFKGFTSTSFNYTVATNALKKQVCGWCEDDRAVIRVFNPQGTKGVIVDGTLQAKDWQSEWLLDKNQKYVLVGKGMVDYDGDEVYTYDILLY